MGASRKADAQVYSSAVQQPIGPGRTTGNPDKPRDLARDLTASRGP
jgi:hypothetical protein